MLTPATNARGWTEKTWVTAGSNPPTQGSGSGCSASEAKPAWQADSGCSNRTTADVSAVAANVIGYDSYENGGGGWYYFFGTSVSSPLAAGVYGLAGNASSQTIAPASLAYANPTHLFDITSGKATGTCSVPYLCKAGKGYDGPTGMGTPRGIGAY
jgi:subtilase family serine protease